MCFLAGTVITGGELVYYRPIPVDWFSKVSRLNYAFASQGTIIDDYGFKRVYFYNLGQVVINGLLTSICRFFMFSCGRFQIIKDENYLNFLSLVVASDKSGVTVKDYESDNRPLLTISNHRSLVDDPGMMSCLLPSSMCYRVKFLRYSICAKEYCFSDKVGEKL